MKDKGRKNTRPIQSANAERPSVKEMIKPDENFDQVVCGAPMQLNHPAKRKPSARINRLDYRNEIPAQFSNKPRSGSAVVRLQKKEPQQQTTEQHLGNKLRNKIPVNPPELQMHVNQSVHSNVDVKTHTSYIVAPMQVRHSNYTHADDSASYASMIRIKVLGSEGPVERFVPYEWLEEKCTDPLFHLSDSYRQKPNFGSRCHTECSLGNIEFEWNSIHNLDQLPHAQEQHKADIEYDGVGSLVSLEPKLTPYQHNQRDQEISETSDNPVASDISNERYIPFHYQSEIKRENFELRKKLDDIKSRPNKHMSNGAMSKHSDSISAPKFSEQVNGASNDESWQENTLEIEHRDLNVDDNGVGMHKRHHKCQHPDDGKPVNRNIFKRNAYKRDETVETGELEREELKQAPQQRMQSKERLQRQKERHIQAHEHQQQNHKQNRQIHDCQERKQEQCYQPNNQHQQQLYHNQQQKQTSQEHRHQHEQKEKHHLQQQQQQLQQHRQRQERLRIQHQDQQRQLNGQQKQQLPIHVQQRDEDQRPMPKQENQLHKRQTKKATTDARHHARGSKDEDVKDAVVEITSIDMGKKNEHSKVLETRDKYQYHNKEYDSVGEIDEHDGCQERTIERKEVRKPFENVLTEGDERRFVGQSKPHVTISEFERMQERWRHEITQLKDTIHQMKNVDTKATQQDVVPHNSSHQVIDSKTYFVRRAEDFRERMTINDAILENEMNLVNDREEYEAMKRRVRQVVQDQFIDSESTYVPCNKSIRAVGRTDASDTRVQENPNSMNISEQSRKSNWQNAAPTNTTETQNQKPVKKITSTDPAGSRHISIEGEEIQESIAFNNDENEPHKMAVQNWSREKDNRTPSFVHVNVGKCPSSDELCSQRSPRYSLSSTTVGESDEVSQISLPRPHNIGKEPVRARMKQPRRAVSKRKLLLPFLSCCTQDYTIPAIATLGSIERKCEERSQTPSPYQQQEASSLMQQSRPVRQDVVGESVQTDVHEVKCNQRQHNLTVDRQLHTKRFQNTGSHVNAGNTQSRDTVGKPQFKGSDQPKQRRTAKESGQCVTKSKKAGLYRKGKAMVNTGDEQQTKPLEERRKDAKIYGTVKHHQKVQKDNIHMHKRIENMENKVNSWNSEKQLDTVSRKAAQFGTKDAHERAQQEFAAEKKRLKQIKPRVDARQSESMEHHLNARLAVIQDVHSTINPPKHSKNNRAQTVEKRQTTENGYQPSWANKQTRQNQRNDQSKRNNQHGEYHFGMTSNGFLYKTYIPK